MVSRIAIIALVVGLLVACQPPVDPVEPVDGKAVVVKVWFTVHCEYCRQQVAVLQTVQNEIDGSWTGENVEIVLIDPFDTGEEIAAFLKENDYDFWVATAPMPMTISGVPIMVISIAGQEEPVFQGVGLVRTGALLAALRNALDELVLRGTIPPRR